MSERTNPDGRRVYKRRRNRELRDAIETVRKWAAGDELRWECFHALVVASRTAPKEER